MHDQTPVRIIGIAGSLRKASYNRGLLDAATSLAPPSIHLEVFDRLDELPVFSDDLSDQPPEGVTALRESVARADGVLIATPEYNRSVPGVVKNMIDWLSVSELPQGLDGRPVAVTGATTGPWGTRVAQVTLQQMLVSVGAFVLPSPSLFIPRADSLFDTEGRITDATTAGRLVELLESFERWIRLLGEFAAA